jgi:hypothetical protein
MRRHSCVVQEEKEQVVMNDKGGVIKAREDKARTVTAPASTWLTEEIQGDKEANV